MVDRARIIAEDVLFPAALEVDAAGAIPPSHFERLAREGFYGLAGETVHGGSDVDLESLAEIIEILSGGCLTTTFTWMQHHSLVRTLTTTRNTDLREQYLEAMIRGEVRGGVSHAGAIPRPPLLWATPTDGGWLINGEAPLVTGWGIVHLVLISARQTTGSDGSDDPGGHIVSGVIDAEAGGGVSIAELSLLAAQGSNTVRLLFDRYFLPARQMTAVISHADFLAGQHISAWLNGRMAMGVAARCIRLVDQAGRSQVAQRLHDQHQSVRELLDRGVSTPERLPAARAAASELAYRAAGILVTTVGSSALLCHRHAGRLVREATFTLVAAGRPEIKDSLVELLAW